MQQRFEGKVAFVTGAASGIGLATVQRLAREGASVYACDLNEAVLHEEMAKLTAEGRTVTARALNVTDSAACQGAIAEAVQVYGQLDVLCNVAGISLFSHFIDMKLSDWDKVIAINLTSVMVLSQAALPHLLQSKGNIVNVASTASLVGLPYNAAYCASKAGVLMLTKSLAVDMAEHSVRVNAVCPGGVNTPLTQGVVLPENTNFQVLGRAFPLLPTMGDPAEIAGSIAYLASEEARYITGSHLVIDGGQTII
jgi:meso-butanediol dehydrogenase/(S,S)-butanediol dehydrogenase/diacetyl reductase